MRILIDYRPALRARSGSGEYIHELARALARSDAAAGDQLTLFSSSWRDRLAGALTDEMPGVRLVDRRVPVRALNFAWHRLGWPPVEWLTGGRHDVVHAPHPLLIPSRAAASFVTIHDLDFLTHPERTRAEIRRDYAALAGRHARRATRVVVSSRYTAGEVERRLEVESRRIVVCPAGATALSDLVGAARLRDEATSREAGVQPSYLLFLGTLEPRKNIGGLLDAYEVLRSRLRDTPPLVLAGAATPAARPWLERIAHPPLADSVKYMGYVAAGQRQALYAGARALVVPSFEEGFGMTALEAMSLGVPVVASNRGSLPEVVGTAGILCEPEPDAIAAAVERVLTGADTARRLSEQGRARAQEFSWSGSAKILRQAYADALAEVGAEPDM